jgi:iron-sulfur cluster repair protein YtfE (RIC family)
MTTPSGTNPGHQHITTPSPKGERGAISQVHRQHEEIVRHLRDLDERLAALRGPSRAGDVRNDVAGRLARLQSELAEHFAEEERVGFLPEAASLEPRLTHRARRILSQHDLLRLELSNVVSTLARGTADWHQVREDFASFTSLLREHEQRENELINEAYLDDLGGGS